MFQIIKGKIILISKRKMTSWENKGQEIHKCEFFSHEMQNWNFLVWKFVISGKLSLVFCKKLFIFAIQS